MLWDLPMREQLVSHGLHMHSPVRPANVHRGKMITEVRRFQMIHSL